MSSNIFIVDTNFIIRYLLADIPEQYQVTTDFFNQVRTSKYKAIIKETVLTEVIFVLSSHYKVSRDRIVKVLFNLLRYKGVIIDDKETIFEALSIYESSKLHIVDSILAASAKVQHHNIMTFDLGLKKCIDMSKVLSK